MKASTAQKKRRVSQNTAEENILSFQGGKGINNAEVMLFATTVNDKAMEVCKGIVEQLKKENLYGTTIKKGSFYEIYVTEIPIDPVEIILSELEEVPVTDNDNDNPIQANITITGNTNDIPRIINALNRFFANWRAVAGLIATGAAAVTGWMLLNVYRR